MFKAVKQIFNKVWGFIGAIALAAFLMPAKVMAEPTGLTLPSTIDLSDLFPMVAGIVAALVGLIVVRKAIKTANRT